MPWYRIGFGGGRGGIGRGSLEYLKPTHHTKYLIPNTKPIVPLLFWFIGIQASTLVWINANGFPKTLAYPMFSSEVAYRPFHEGTIILGDFGSMRVLSRGIFSLLSFASCHVVDFGSWSDVQIDLTVRHSPIAYVHSYPMCTMHTLLGMFYKTFYQIRVSKRRLTCKGCIST